MRALPAIVGAAALVFASACGGGGGENNNGAPDAGSPLPEDAGTGSPRGPALQGRWRLETEGPGRFSLADVMTIEFLEEGSGAARFLGRVATNGVTVCGDYVFALVNDGVLMLESSRLPRGVFMIEQESESTLRLTSSTETLVLTRSEGPAPVAECGQAEVESIAVLDVSPAWSGRLTAVGRTLYFNVSDATGSIVGYSLESGTLGPERAYTVVSLGGIDRYIFAAENDDIFYGHCACGGSRNFSRFDVSQNLKLAQVETPSLGAEIRVRYGYFSGSELVVGGQGGGVDNKLLTLNASTLTLVSERAILHEQQVNDIVRHDGKLLALTMDGRIMSVGQDGKATQTWELNALRGLNAIGITSSDGELYLLAADENYTRAYLFKVTLID